MKKRINSRAKGAAVEREAAEFLRGFGFNVTRNARNGLSAADLDVSEDPVLSKLHIEVKGDKSIDLHTKALADAWIQASSGHKANQLPVVLWKKHRVGWFLTWEMTADETRDPILATVQGEDIPATLRWLAK